ncbi:EAL and HDOD domain-containing protein [Idiomarina aminovorans]|uniref:EAL and HDOD domain-containing protein n=1 Tax=Idiomarina aminovorans TaxID=2914829 RepID=UPI002004DE32|nr:HDOD domain-containing protein [Idiomarina sp. ATCH4]MCK7460376.1 HDOD domain-containing protein [Idiomarina sp. ATCH4]
MTETFPLLAAQPIYDIRNQFYAVELLYRSAVNLTAETVGDTAATSEVIFNLCAGITRQTEQYDATAFINVSSEFLVSQSFLPIEPDKVVIELVERIKPTKAIINAVARWHKKGFRFALDDFEFDPAWEPLLKYASYIKVDVSTLTLEQAKTFKQKLSGFKGKWLAERVEDEVTKEAYEALGFELFQGYYFAKPKVVYGTRLEPSSLQLTKVLTHCFEDEPDLTELSNLISEDPKLSVSLLKIVNSPLYPTVSPVTRVKDVIMRLGIENLRRWIALISSVSASSQEASRMVLVRAQMCYELAKRQDSPDLDPDQCYFVGLLSGIDIMLGVDKACFFEKLPLSEQTKAAVDDCAGPMGRCLNIALKLERFVQMKERVDKIEPRLLRTYRQVSYNVQELFNTI